MWWWARAACRAWGTASAPLQTYAARMLAALLSLRNVISMHALQCEAARMQRLLGLFGVRGSQKRVFTILKDVTGILKPVRHGFWCCLAVTYLLEERGAGNAHVEVHTLV